MSETVVCPNCGHDRFTEIRDATIEVRCEREQVSGGPWNRKFFTEVVDCGTAHYMMTCSGCGRALEQTDLVEKSPE